MAQTNTQLFVELSIRILEYQIRIQQGMHKHHFKMFDSILLASITAT